MNSFNRIQDNIKYVTDESAAGAALFYDEEAFSEGYLKSKVVEANKYVKYTMEKAINTLHNMQIINSDYYLYIIDESGIEYTYKNAGLLSEKSVSFPYYFIVEGNNGILISNPSVIVMLKLRSKDIFRLPFLNCEFLSRSSMYEIKCKGNYY